MSLSLMFEFNLGKKKREFSKVENAGKKILAREKKDCGSVGAHHGGALSLDVDDGEGEAIELILSSNEVLLRCNVGGK